jgi:AAA15 family ATPase/GTPase
MILNFSIENWKSFRDRAVLSMLPTREKQHGYRVPYFSKCDVRILPISSVYGGNASGKSNFCQALFTLQSIIVDGTQPNSEIPVYPFCLDECSPQKATSFEIDFAIGDAIYRYSISATRQKISEEKLVRIDGRTDVTMYDRHDQTIELGNCWNETQKKRLRLIINGEMVRSNQTFLRTVIDWNFKDLFDIWDYFRSKLIFIFPNSKYVPTEKLIDVNSNKEINNLLSKLDTGISRIGGIDININSIEFKEEGKAAINILKEGDVLRLDDIVVQKKNGKLIVKRLVSYHQRFDNREVYFGLDKESDGSRRVIDILPAIIDLQSSDRIYVIDEINRSLHPDLTKAFITEYLNGCSENSRAQLLITLHDIQLIDQDIFRRDEIRFTERERDGNTNLFSLSDFEGVHHDKDILKSYQQGRFGGIPNIATYLHYREKS